MRNRGYWVIIWLFFMIIGGKSFSQSSEPISMVDSYGPSNESREADGLWTFIYSDGSTGHCTFISDKATGHWVDYWKNGKLRSITSFESGYRQGFDQYYDSLGNINSLEYFEKGLSLYYYEYYHTGVIKEYREFIVDTVEMEVLVTDPYTYETWTKIRKEPESIKHGTWKFYDEKGLLVREEKYVRDILQE